MERERRWAGFQVQLSTTSRRTRNTFWVRRVRRHVGRAGRRPIGRHENGTRWRLRRCLRTLARPRPRWEGFGSWTIELCCWIPDSPVAARWMLLNVLLLSSTMAPGMFVLHYPAFVLLCFVLLSMHSFSLSIGESFWGFEAWRWEIACAVLVASLVVGFSVWEWACGLLEWGWLREG